MKQETQKFPGTTHRVEFLFREGSAAAGQLCVILADASTEPGLQLVDELSTIDEHLLFVTDDFGPYAGEYGYPGCWYLGEGRRQTFADDVSALVAHAAATLQVKSHDVTAAGFGKGGFAALFLAIRNKWGRAIAGAPQTRLGAHLAGDLESVAEFVAGDAGPADRRWLDDVLFDEIATAPSLPEVNLFVGRGDPSYAKHAIPLLEALEERREPADLTLIGATEERTPVTHFAAHLIDRLFENSRLELRTLEIAEDPERHASSWNRRSEAVLTRRPDGIRCFAPATEALEVGVYAGARFPAGPFEMIRADLLVRRPQDIETLIFDAIDSGGGRLGRWQQQLTDRSQLSGGRTSLLLGRQSIGPVKASVDGDLSETAFIDVFARIRSGRSADFTVERLRLVPAAPARDSAELPLPIPADAAAASSRTIDPSSTAKRVKNLVERGEFPSPAELPEGPPRRPGLKVACLLDPFSELGFRHEFEYVDFTPEDYREVIDRERPDLLLVESVWRGKDEAWNKLMVPDSLGGGPTEPVRDLVAHCRSLGIPTVFWNKEDPPNFEHFVKTAVLFDHVFTTDESCVPRYVAAAGHNRVGVLPFAAQPRIHNPVGAPAARPLDIAFLGTFYGQKHAARKQQMEMILDPAREFGVHIYSRVASAGGYKFPDKYAAHLIGTIPYERVLGAYRSYRVLLNVNSVPNSRTMCARRIFEILASGGTVVSGPSPAIDAILGKGVVHESHSYGETREILEHVLSNEALRQRVALDGARRVLAEHTYSDRVDSILAAVGLSTPLATRALTVVAGVEDLEQARNVVRSALDQSRPPEQLVLVAQDESLDLDSVLGSRSATDTEVELAALGADAARAPGAVLSRGLEQATGDLIGLMAPGAVYGAHYLEDLRNALDQSGAAIVGKGAHYRFDGGRGWAAIVDREAESSYVDAILSETLLAERRVFDRVRLTPAENLSDWQRRCRSVGLRIYASDRFNFTVLDDVPDTITAGSGQMFVEAFGSDARHAIA